MNYRRYTVRYRATRPRSRLVLQIERLVGAELTPFVLFWEFLRAFRPWWSILVPALLLYLRRRYRIEQKQAIDEARQIVIGQIEERARTRTKR